jgi:uncharacterized protein YnzC (UPF0291/DUF896 family)
MNIERTIARINELSRKKRTVGLSDEELLEQQALRKVYIDSFKSNLRNQLETIKFTDSNNI